MEPNTKLPDYRSKEDGVLYIIGNGFDLYHGLHTKYMDFRNWLMKDHADFVHNLEEIYPDNKELWSDFEKALGNNKDCSELDKIFRGQTTDSLPSEQQQTYAAEKIKETLDQICPLLKKWACTFHDEYNNVKEILPLGKGSKYITFNYTNVLEEVYHIEGDDTVLHIHGRADKENVITGYDFTRDEIPFGSPIEEISQENIKRELVKLRKPTASIYEKHVKFFKQLKNINTIIVIGHSLADVDIPYFRYMLNALPKFIIIKWQYWVHSEEAMINIQKRIKGLCYNNLSLQEMMMEERWEYYKLPKKESTKKYRLEEATKKAIELGIIK